MSKLKLNATQRIRRAMRDIADEYGDQGAEVVRLDVTDLDDELFDILS